MLKITDKETKTELFGLSSSGRSWGREYRITPGQANTIETGKGGAGQSTQTIVQQKNIRRLTPVECERLQGFPDNWTEGLLDTQRYKTMGNAVTVNVVQAIAEKMLQEKLFATLPTNDLSFPMTKANRDTMITDRRLRK